MRKKNFVEYDDEDNLIGDADEELDDRERSRRAYAAAMKKVRAEEESEDEADEDDDEDEISAAAYESRRKARRVREERAAKAYEQDREPEEKLPEDAKKVAERLNRKLQRQRDKINGLERKATIFMVLWIVAMVVAGALGVKLLLDHKAQESENVSINGTTTKLTYSLDKVAADFSSDIYTAQVTEVNGYEYLQLSTTVEDKELSLYFQNEFPKEEDSSNYMECFVSNGTDIVMVNSSYDFDNISAELPKIVAMSDEGSGLLYVSYDENDVPTGLSLVNITTMENVGSINFKTSLPYYFTVKVADEAEKYVSVTSEDVTYTYNVEASVYDKVVDSGNAALEMCESFEYEITDTGFTFDSSVSFGAGFYIGQYTGTITYTSTGLNLSSSEFGAYVYPEYEDPGDPQLLVPEGTRWTDYYTLAGLNGGTILVQKYTSYPKSTLDTADLTRNESGYWTWGDSTNGIDVSTYQGSVDWDAVKAAGTDFVIVRAGYRGYSEGGLATDSNLATNVAGAKAAGLKVGVYFFSQATTEAEGKEEAEYVLDLIKDLGVTGPVVFDTEYYTDPKDARGNIVSRENRTLATKAFCSTVADAGYTPMIYASTRWLVMGINMDELTDYKLWYAAYSNEPLIDLEFAIWQYSNTGSVSGVSGDVDVNIMVEDVFSN